MFNPRINGPNAYLNSGGGPAANLQNPTPMMVYSINAYNGSTTTDGYLLVYDGPYNPGKKPRFVKKILKGASDGFTFPEGACFPLGANATMGTTDTPGGAPLLDTVYVDVNYKLL